MKQFNAKAIAILIALLFASHIQYELSAQTSRVVLVEQVTSASCGPCATVNPSFNTLLLDNEEDIAVIKYQRGGGSYIDPMWDFNPTEVDYRVPNFYGVTSFPQTWVNGTYTGSPSNIDQSVLDNAAVAAPGFDIDLSFELNTAKDSIHIEATFTSLVDYQQPADHQIRAYVVIVEEDIEYAQAPGLNGETHFYSVMRKMLPTASGLILGQQLVNDETTVSYSYAIDNTVINPDELEVVALVQRANGNKEVLQSVMQHKKEDEQPNAMESPKDLSFDVFPSPSNGLVTIRLSQEELKTLTISNAIGSVVYSEEVNGRKEMQVDLSNLSNGVYFAQVEGTKEKVATQRILINK